MAISKLILNGITQMDVTSDTVTAGSMLSGTTATKNDGTKVTGNIVSRSATDLTASGSTVTVPAGYYSSQVTKNVASATHPNPTADFNTSTGVFTASHTQTAGYVAAGTTTSTYSLTTQAAQTITPGTTNQTISSNRWLTGAQTILGDSNLVASNIASGVSIFGVEGTHQGSSGLEYEEGTYTPSTNTALPIFTFNNTHTTPPMFVMCSDATGTYSGTTMSPQAMFYCDWQRYTGEPIVRDANAAYLNYAVFIHRFRGTDSSQFTQQNYYFMHSSDEQGDGTTAYPDTFVTRTSLSLGVPGTTMYFRAGRTYKWIAVWPPTT